MDIWIENKLDKYVELTGRKKKRKTTATVHGLHHGGHAEGWRDRRGYWGQGGGR